MPDMLHLKPEEVDTAEKRAKYRVCVVGCQQPSMVYAVMFAETGFKVTCADADQSLVKNLAKGRTTFFERGLETKLKGYVRAGTLSVTSDVKNAVAQSDVVLLFGTLKIGDDKNVDFSDIEKNCRQIGSGIQRGVLIIYAGVADFGFTEGVVKETVESVSGFKAGQDFGLAYANAQVSGIDFPANVVGERELLVGTNDKVSLDAASIVLSTIARNGIRQIMNIKLAELTTLFALARRNVTVALTNELAVLCEKAKVDYFETLKLTTPGCLESDLIPTIYGEDKRLWTQLLLEGADNFGVKLRLLELSRHVNEDVVRHAVSLTQDALRDCGKTLRRSRIAVLGSVGAGTSGESFVKMLEAKGARINLYNPGGGRNEELDPMRAPKRSLNEAAENCDCMVVLSAEDQVKRLSLRNLRQIMKTQAAIVDLAGIFQPGQVQGEGFLYRGLGRGFDKE
jgi:nucleotide sugar dehydrogenase